MTKGKLLVTGGCGYIGSHVACQLSEEGYEVVVFDNLSTGDKNALINGEQLIIGDLADSAKLESVFRDHDITSVLHFAASIVVPESVSNPIKYYENNTVNAIKLLHICQQYKVKHFIFSSTAATYGETNVGSVDESLALNPTNPYAASKAMTERVLQDVAKTCDLAFVILRYFNVAGADLLGRMGQRTPNATHLIKVACETALGKRDKMSIFGSDYPTPDGTCIRDYIHVVDLAIAHLCGLKYLEGGGASDIFNCGYGEGFSVKQVIDRVKAIAKVDFQVDLEGRRPGDIPAIVAMNKKIKERLGWQPKHNNLDVIIKTALSWEKSLGKT